MKSMKSTTATFVVMAVLMTMVAISIESRLLPLAISSIVALAAMVVGLVLLMRNPAVPVPVTSPLYDREKL